MKGLKEMFEEGESGYFLAINPGSKHKYELFYLHQFEEQRIDIEFIDAFEEEQDVYPFITYRNSRSDHEPN